MSYEFQEYPKMLTAEDGSWVIVESAEEEAEYNQPSPKRGRPAGKRDK